MNLSLKRIKILINGSFNFFVIIAVVFSLVYGIKYICNVNDNSETPICRVDTKEKKVAITFNVAWGSDNIEKVMEILDKHDAKATFFLVGGWIENNQDYAKKISDGGHEIANNTATNADLMQISRENVKSELDTARQQIKEVCNQNTDIVRPPFGNIDSNTIKECNKLGYRIVKWDVDSSDWREIGPNHVIERVMKDTRPGSIVLFHANAANVEDYLDTVLTGLEEKGYKFEKVSNLLYKDNYKVDQTGLQSKK
ncbi:MAG: polysaccharide deacetylase family protein [Clostridioides sp.]|jgi:polysaccharide deacetylase family sporulation protein PdaB|nr:polysaccharide deacetylase family protein [Clostridioides sp.]